MSTSPLGEGNAKLERLPRRERENLRQRGEILDGALRLFSEKGYHNVSMHEIAKEAEFGIGTIYKFFANKEDLHKILIMETLKDASPSIGSCFLIICPSCACIMPKPKGRAST
jgi:hypothetical protein